MNAYVWLLLLIYVLIHIDSMYTYIDSIFIYFYIYGTWYTYLSHAPEGGADVLEHLLGRIDLVFEVWGSGLVYTYKLIHKY